jgi:hypothetical protein
VRASRNITEDLGYHMWSRQNWKFFIDPGEFVLSSKHKIKGVKLQPYLNGTTLPYFSKKVQFRGKYLMQNASTLEEETLYESKANNSPYTLGECVMVDHKSKKVFFAQSTSRNLSDHSFNVNTLVEVAEKLHTIENNYKIVILMCADSSRKSTSGTRFNLIVDEKENKMSFEELKKIARNEKEKLIFENFQLQQQQKLKILLSNIKILKNI